MKMSLEEIIREFEILATASPRKPVRYHGRLAPPDLGLIDLDGIYQPDRSRVIEVIRDPTGFESPEAWR